MKLPKRCFKRLIFVLFVAFTVVMSFLPLSVLAAKSVKSSLVIHVNATAKPNGNGSAQKPFQNLPEAVASAKIQSGTFARIIIVVNPGSYSVPNPLSIDFPVSIQGANVPLSGSDLWPTGNVRADSETLLSAQSCAGPLILVNGKNDAPAMNVELRNLSFTGVAGACPGPRPSILVIQHAENFLVTDVVITGPAGSGIDIAASSGVVRGSYVSQTDNCGICIGAGTDESPTQVTVTDNRSRSHGGGSLLISGTTYPLFETGNRIDVNVLHNDLSDNTASAALGFGIRVLAFGVDVPPAQNEGYVTARFLDNRLDNNRNSIMIDAGFPYRNSAAGACVDLRKFVAGLDLTLRGNVITNSVNRNAVIAFTRGQVVTGSTNPNNSISRWQYLHDSTIAIVDPEQTLLPYVLNHPLKDPYVGPSCPDDGSAEVLNNSLYYNGVEVQENS